MTLTGSVMNTITRPDAMPIMPQSANRPACTWRVIDIKQEPNGDGDSDGNQRHGHNIAEPYQQHWVNESFAEGLKARADQHDTNQHDDQVDDVNKEGEGHRSGRQSPTALQIASHSGTESQ